MKLTPFAIAVIANCASPVAAQTISLHPGETVTVRLDHGVPVIEQRGSAPPMTKFEIYSLWRAETQEVPADVKVVPPGFVTRGEGAPDAPHPFGDTLQITMRRVPALKQGSPDNTALFLSNGYGLAIRYRAVRRSADRSSATDVCDLVPHLLGLEHWPYSIEELDLSNFEFIQWNGSVQCG